MFRPWPEFWSSGQFQSSTVVFKTFTVYLSFCFVLEVARRREMFVHSVKIVAYLFCFYVRDYDWDNV